MFDLNDTSPFLRALRSGSHCGCGRCKDGKPVVGEECYLESAEWLHPADVWTISELRKISINGSFT